MEISFHPRPSYSTIVLHKEKPLSNGSPNSQIQNLESMLYEAMEHGLSHMGEDFAQVTFYNLDRRYSLGRLEILKEPERFIRALRDMFGEGAKIIESFIKQAICTEIGLNPSLFKRTSLSSCIRKIMDLAADKLTISR